MDNSFVQLLHRSATTMYDSHIQVHEQLNDTGTTHIEIVQPCVTNGNNKIKGTQPLRVPAFVENVFELLVLRHMVFQASFSSIREKAHYILCATRGSNTQRSGGDVPTLETSSIVPVYKMSRIAT